MFNTHVYFGWQRGISNDPLMSFLLVITLLAIAYIQVGYACIMWALAKMRSHPQASESPMPEAVSIVLCIHNGAGRIQERLKNLAACPWEGEREYIVFCDGCEDDSAELAASSGVKNVRVLSHPKQRGKWAALNDSVKSARHPIIIFADLRQSFDEHALQRLAEAFNNPEVGAASGLLTIAKSESGAGRGVDLYWRMETRLRECEARVDSVIGCTGAIYAIRRELYTDLQPDTILDDVVVPMQIALKGWRIAYVPTALAFDPQTLDPAKESERKLRTLVGNYQMIERHPGWLLPWRNRLWIQLISHKYARLAVPWLMIIAFALNAAAPKTPLIWLLLTCQTACYGLGIAGCAFGGLRSRLVTVPAGFLMLQWSCARALLTYMRCRHSPLSLWGKKPDGRQLA
ncbi:glycosyltransferase [Prosthecobacter fluviatilis]|uniref:Glycosyltransferase n=1 Tax=Prosthecobacter fluviatilis TaxID=445931 RepID=A0ABW0KJQ9_9BACT